MSLHFSTISCASKGTFVSSRSDLTVILQRACEGQKQRACAEVRMQSCAVLRSTGLVAMQAHTALHAHSSLQMHFCLHRPLR